MSDARVLVIKQEGLRQFVEAEPAFATIRNAHRRSAIDLLTNPEFGRIAKGAPFFDRVLAGGSFAEKTALKQMVAQLKRIGYGRIYDLDGTRATMDLKGAMTGFRGPKWVGPRRIMTRQNRPGIDFPAASMRKMLADAELPVEHRLPDLSWALDARKDAANMQPSWFGLSGAYCLLLPADDSAERWPASHYAQVAQQLFEQFGLLSVIMGPETLTPFAQEVMLEVSSRSRQAGRMVVVDLTGKADLAQMAMLATNCEFFVAGLGEPLHLSVSVGAKGVVLVRDGQSADVDSLFGRAVIKLTSSDMTKLDPAMVVTMLRSMGVVGEPVLQRAPAFGR